MTVKSIFFHLKKTHHISEYQPAEIALHVL